MTTGDGDVRITVTEFYQEQKVQNTEMTKALGEIKTSLAAMLESVKPQSGINSELFRRVLGLEKKVWALPSGAVLLGLISLAVAMYRK